MLTYSLGGTDTMIMPCGQLHVDPWLLAEAMERRPKQRTRKLRKRLSLKLLLKKSSQQDPEQHQLLVDGTNCTKTTSCFWSEPCESENLHYASAVWHIPRRATHRHQHAEVSQRLEKIRVGWTVAGSFVAHVRGSPTKVFSRHESHVWKNKTSIWGRRWEEAKWMIKHLHIFTSYYLDAYRYICV